MSFLTALGVKIGTTLSVALLRSCLKDVPLLADVGADIASTAAAASENLLEVRRTTRLFEQIADDIATKLEPFIAAEFRIDQGERQAALEAVNDVIHGADLSDDVLLRNDLDALTIEAHVKAHGVERLRSAGLSSEAEEFYDLILSQACAYLVQLRVALPGFSSVALMELLRRDTRILDLLRQVLERLPEPRSLSEQQDPDLRFEIAYRRAVAQRLDRLQLFGLSDPLNMRYPLSVAYISLIASTTSAPGVGRPTRDEDEEQASERVDSILGHGDRHLIRGEAGSGKTTLLQWLAVRAAQQDFEGDLADWASAVPFFIRLRQHVDGSLPPPEGFVAEIAENLSGNMPDGWVHRILADRRALVLVDGVDELPEKQRDRAHLWLEQLAADFPDNRFVVTSRPPAVEDTWLGGIAFGSSELLPMELPDILSFISHWHVAASSEDEDQRKALMSAEVALSNLIRDTPAVRGLATNPLLCAMICALHLDRHGKLPLNRMELYRTALEMLLDRRDVEREVPDVDEVSLTLPQKHLLLQEFAYWLTINDRSDGERAHAVATIKRRLSGMQVPGDPTAEQVFEFLLVRSGLIREPVVGRVDFIHRTFEEYLAAKEIVDQTSMGLLVDRASQDQWGEVVVLAAGHARASEAEALVRSLVARGHEDELHRHRLHLLAVACLETAPEVAPALRSEIMELLRTLVPPENMTEARALSRAGELAIPLLRGRPRQVVSTDAACVRTLAWIGGPDALAALAEYSRDERVTLARELIHCWQYFDPVQYAEKVLAPNMLDRGSLLLREPALVPVLDRLERLRTLEVEVPPGVGSLDYLGPVAEKVVSLSIVSSSMGDLTPVRELVNLERLDLWYLGALGNLDFLGGSGLRELTVRGCQQLRDLTGLQRTAGLTTLSLGDLGRGIELAPLAALASCTTADLVELGDIDYSPVARMPGLAVLSFSDDEVRSMESFTGAGGIRTASIASCASLRDLCGVGSMRQLRALSVSRCSALEDVEDLLGLEELRDVTLSRVAVLKDLRVLAGSLQRIQTLDCSGSGLETVAGVEGTTSLRHLGLSGCRGLTSLDALAGHRSLEHLDVSGIEEADMSVFTTLPKLAVLRTSGNLEPDLRKSLTDRGVRVLGGLHRHPVGGGDAGR